MGISAGFGDLALKGSALGAVTPLPPCPARGGTGGNRTDQFPGRKRAVPSRHGQFSLAGAQPCPAALAEPCRAGDRPAGGSEVSPAVSAPGTGGISVPGQCEPPTPACGAGGGWNRTGQDRTGRVSVQGRSVERCQHRAVPLCHSLSSGDSPCVSPAPGLPPLHGTGTRGGRRQRCSAPFPQAGKDLSHSSRERDLGCVGVTCAAAQGTNPALTGARRCQLRASLAPAQQRVQKAPGRMQGQSSLQSSWLCPKERSCPL